MSEQFRLVSFTLDSAREEHPAAAWLASIGADHAPAEVAAPAGLRAAAWDVELEAASLATLRDLLREETGPEHSSILVPPTLRGSRRSLVVTDVDSTLIEQEVIEMLAAHAGREAEVAAVTERAMRGELDFAQSLHHRVKALAGLPVSLIAEVAADVVPTPGAVELIAAAHASGHLVGAVSGGFIQVLEPLADRLGLDHAHANVLGVRDGVLTGTVQGPVVDRAAKAAALRRWCAADDVQPQRTVGLGDGANDLDLLTVAGLGVGVQPKPALRHVADGVLGLRRLDAVSAALGWGA
ncbi:MAG: phosphoserine phosphatase SerB [Arthrobacter sp.]|jgi:phosphoserine phosphatase|nr:phosphoserine phosphatase SerB [Arthrobacter sp.]